MLVRLLLYTKGERIFRQRALRLIIALLCTASIRASAQTTSPSNGCPTLTPILTKDRVHGRSSATFFAEEVTADPSNVALRLLAVTRQHLPALKQKELAAGFPDSLSGRSARKTYEAEHLFKDLLYEKGLETLNEAFALDPCNAMALDFIAQYDQSVGLQSQAFSALMLAHAIAPDRDDITVNWAEYLPEKTRMEVLRRAIANSVFLSTDKQRSAEEALLAGDMHRPSGLCQKQAGDVKTTLPLFLVRQSPDVKKGQEQFATKIIVNGKPRRMLIDTSASGVMLTEFAARTAGLIVNKETRFAHAATIQVGGFNFKDCDLQLVRLGDAGGSVDGVLGIDAFISFLLTLDFNELQISLSPLPASPMQTAEPYLETAELPLVQRDQTGVYAVDAYRPLFMKDWTSFIFGEHLFLLPVRVVDGGTALGVLMTSVERSMLLRSMLPASISLDALGYTWLPGLFSSWDSNKIDLYQSGPVMVKFAGLQMLLPRTLVGKDSKKAAPSGFAGTIGLDYLRRLSISIDMRDRLIKAEPSRSN